MIRIDSVNKMPRSNKIWIVPLIVACLLTLGSTRAQDKPGVVVFPIPCVTSSHAHRTSDYRIALVKVLEVTTCGFTYEDLEEHAVASEAISIDNGLFQLGSVEFGSKLMTVRLTPAEVKKGVFGVLVYCGHCRAGLLMQTTASGG